MKIIFCLPGASYSGRFLQCQNEIFSKFPKYKIIYGFSPKPFISKIEAG